MWTYEDFEGILENCTIRKKYKDGVLKQIWIIAHEGYAIKFKADEGFTDEEGNYTPPIYSYYVIIGDEADIPKWEAVLIEEGMNVDGNPTNEEIM